MLTIMRIVVVLPAPFGPSSPNTRPAGKPGTRPIPAIQRVLVVSIDGLRPDLLLLADAPNARKLLKRGSYSMWAMTTPQSITLPSHVSMLSGVTPNRHGILWNSDLPLEYPVDPFMRAWDLDDLVGAKLRESEDWKSREEPRAFVEKRKPVWRGR